MKESISECHVPGCQEEIAIRSKSHGNRQRGGRKSMAPWVEFHLLAMISALVSNFGNPAAIRSAKHRATLKSFVYSGLGLTAIG